MRTTFTADEVYPLLAHYYLRGRYDADINELRGTWLEHDEPRATREQRVGARIAVMEAAAERQPWNTWRGQFPGGPVDFETGRPIRNHLRSAA